MSNISEDDFPSLATASAKGASKRRGKGSGKEIPSRDKQQELRPLPATHHGEQPLESHPQEHGQVNAPHAHTQSTWKPRPATGVEAPPAVQPARGFGPRPGFEVKQSPIAGHAWGKPAGAIDVSVAAPAAAANAALATSPMDLQQSPAHDDHEKLPEEVQVKAEALVPTGPGRRDIEAAGSGREAGVEEQIGGGGGGRGLAGGQGRGRGSGGWGGGGGGAGVQYVASTVAPAAALAPVQGQGPVQGRGRGQGYGVSRGRGGYGEPSGRGPGHASKGGRAMGGARHEAAAGGRQEDGGRGGGDGWRRRDDGNALGRCMTRVLRHQARELRLPMRPDGYVYVKDLLRLKLKTQANRPLDSYTEADVREAARVDEKERFGLLEDDSEGGRGGLMIRANQGHSLAEVESEHLLEPITRPEDFPECVHGTYLRHLPSILEHGLSRMKRNHVHFAVGLPRGADVISGMRSSCEVVIYLDLAKAIRDGIVFYTSTNNVVLTEGVNGIVAPAYFSKVIQWPSRKPLGIPKTSGADTSEAVTSEAVTSEAIPQLTSTTSWPSLS